MPHEGNHHVTSTLPDLPRAFRRCLSAGRRASFERCGGGAAQGCRRLDAQGQGHVRLPGLVPLPGRWEQPGMDPLEPRFQSSQPGNRLVELWPDMSEFPAAERYLAPGFAYEHGSPAYLFSSHNAGDRAAALPVDARLRDRRGVGPALPGRPARRTGAKPLPLSTPRHRSCAPGGPRDGPRLGPLLRRCTMPTERIFDSLTADWKKMVDEGIVAGPATCVTAAARRADMGVLLEQ